MTLHLETKYEGIILWCIHIFEMGIEMVKSESKVYLFVKLKLGMGMEKKKKLGMGTGMRRVGLTQNKD